jgi:hypothetical protein
MRFSSLRVPALLGSVIRIMFFAMLSAHSSRCGHPLASRGSTTSTCLAMKAWCDRLSHRSKNRQRQ